MNGSSIFFKIADFPNELLQNVVTPTAPSFHVNTSSIGEGGRNISLTSVAGKLRRIGLDEPNILNVLRIVNQTQCHPPLDDTELCGIAHSVSRYTPTLDWRSNDDATRAYVFQALFGDDLRFSMEMKRWFVWNGQKWDVDTSNAHLKRAKQTAEILIELAFNLSKEVAPVEQ